MCLSGSYIDCEEDCLSDSEIQEINRIVSASKHMKALRVVMGMSEATLGDIAAALTRPVQLLQMPNAESLEALGDAAEHFGNNGGDSDGDLWLAPADVFSPEDLAAALRAGGKVIDGYEFLYPINVIINPRLPWDMITGEVKVGGWCGYNVAGVGYALRREVAENVFVASIALAAEEAGKLNTEQSILMSTS
jgi:hypothetical protein